MVRDDVAFLISQERKKDKYGVLQPTEESKRLIYVRVSNVTRAEWFEGGRNGLNPELHFDTFAPDYCGEEIIEYCGARYTIYRTYRDGADTIELYAERRKGAGDVTAG